MPRKPEPIDGENAEAAEARLRQLRARFGAVSGRYTRRPDGGGSGGRIALTPFEMLLVAGAVLFVLLVAGMWFSG